MGHEANAIFKTILSIVVIENNPPVALFENVAQYILCLIAWEVILRGWNKQHLDYIIHNNASIYSKANLW